MPSHTPGDVVRYGPGVPAVLPSAQAGHTPEHPPPIGRPPEIIGYGPGVPTALSASQAELTAERISRTPTRPSHRGACLGWVRCPVRYSPSSCSRPAACCCTCARRDRQHHLSIQRRMRDSPAIRQLRQSLDLRHRGASSNPV